MSAAAETTLDRVPNSTLHHLASLDEAMSGAVAAMIRAKLLLVVAGAIQDDNLDAAAIFAEFRSMMDQDRRRHLN